MQLLGNDLVINENDCNLACEYCLTGQSNLKKCHEEQLIFQTAKRDVYAPESPLANRINNIVDNIDNSFDHPPLLKVTGGEVFLVKGMLDFIERVADQHEVIIVQTNGVLVREEGIQRLEKLGNIVMQISLDSHLHFGNSYRVKKEDLHQKVVKKIHRLLTSNLKTEIYAVINDRSVTELDKFSAWLAENSPGTVFLPFPIRGPGSEPFQVKQEQRESLFKFLQHAPQYGRIMPPQAYLDRLQSFYEHGERTFRCHLPRLVISSFSDGLVTACPNIWFDHLGDALANDWNEKAQTVNNKGLYKLLLADRPRLDACKGCFTPWDTLSMYFDDEITLNQLCEAPTYNFPKIRQLLSQLKEQYQNEAK